VDAVLSAEAFHWFATREAVAEIARVVRPGGGLALLWNLHDLGHEPWLEEMGRVLSERLPTAMASADRNRPESWQQAFEGAPFGPIGELSVRHEQRTDAAGLVAHVLTWSHSRALEDAAREEFARELREVVDRAHPTPDDVAIPYRTAVYWARRR
jgi:SAM-dependent methyltransferase